MEVVSYYLVAYASVDRPSLKPIDANADLGLARKPSREVDFDTYGIHETHIYDRNLLGAGARFPGPAVIEEVGGTTVVFPTQEVEVDQFGNLHITHSANSASASSN